MPAARSRIEPENLFKQTEPALSGLRIFLSAFAGKIAAAIFIAACAALGFGPSQWVMFIAGHWADSWIARVIFISLGLTTFVFLVLAIRHGGKVKANAVMKRLDRDDRFLIALEGKHSHFGPFPHGDGTYSYLPWDRVHGIVNKLIELGIIEVSNSGQYNWTRLGKDIAGKIPERDAQIPDHER